MRITSTAFQNGTAIPKQFTCDSQNISPEICWRDAPKDTQCFALILHDPDAPRANGFAHWLVYNIPATFTKIHENAAQGASLEGSALQGKNDAGRLGYMGPCPPSGTHRYFFRLYALRHKVNLAPGATHQELMSAMEGSILERAELMGTYGPLRTSRGDSGARGH